MTLGDIIGGMRLHLFAEAALLVACLAFLGVLVTTFLRRNREPFERARLLPLQEDDAPGPRRAAPGTSRTEETSDE